MILWTLGELTHLTRQELMELDQMIRKMLGVLQVGTVAQTKALTNLDNIRWMLVCKDWHP